MKKCLNLVTKTLIVTLIGVMPWGQIRAQDANAVQSKDGDLLVDSMRDLTIITATGIGGAVLGLSTLSFSEQPSKHLKNIVIGGAVGIIIGVGIVVYSQAGRTEQSTVPEKASSDFDTRERLAWHQQSFEKFNTLKQATQLSYNFSF